MLSNDKNSQVLINEILTNKYEVDLIHITISKGDEKLHGKGTIFQNVEGRLLIKVFSDIEYNEHQRLNMLFEDRGDQNSEGSIISEFYQLEGLDENRLEYFCDKIDMQQHKDNVMHFRLLGDLTSRKAEGSSTRIILAGKYQIPSTGIVNFTTKVDENYWFTDYKNIWMIDVNENFKILITNYENYLDVLINTNQDAEYSDIDDILNSLNFVLGIESEPLFINVNKKGHKVLNRRNILKAKSLFDPPLTSNHNYGSEYTMNHNRLFNSYYNFIRQDTNKKLPIIHRRVVSGSRNYVYAAALIISVQIETICKLYLSDFYEKDKEFVSTLGKCIELIANSDIENRERVISSLKGRVTDNKVNAKDILHKLATTNHITQSLLKPYSSLRNSTAHGDNYENDDNTKLIGNLFLCTNLYYQLIFHLIGYEGRFSWKEYGKNRIETYPIKSI